MAKLVWDKPSERLYEAGVKNAVLYPVSRSDDDDPGIAYKGGVVWNGLISVTESPSGAEPTPLYADDMKYLNLMSVEEFGATIEAYTYPKEFAACNGEIRLIGLFIGQQPRKTFGLSYKTSIGNAENDALGYKIHIVYGCLAAPSEKAYSSINDSPEATTFSWEISTTPINFGDGFKPSAHIVIDSTKVSPETLKSIEDTIYGTDDTEPYLPSFGGI